MFPALLAALLKNISDALIVAAVTDGAGNPIDPANIASARWVAMETRDGEPVAESYPADFGFSTGLIQVTVSSASMPDPGTYWHELSVETTEGYVFPVSEGLLYVRRSAIPEVE